ncbi:MAG: c-type cytochrome [Verrucomicrobiales bacterium]|nr:c-type cytochrome [Verrucomicrobiales bacterium]
MRTAFRPFFCLLACTATFSVATLESQEKKESARPVIPKGSVAAGKTIFVAKGCYQCHSAGEIKFPVSELEETLVIELGGEKQQAWSRDDYARAILNPNHTVSPDYEKAMMILGDHFKAVNSPMPGFNDILTASDLIHLSTFLTSLPE